MSVLQDGFDPLAVVVDWLDACRWGGLDTLLTCTTSGLLWNAIANA